MTGAVTLSVVQDIGTFDPESGWISKACVARANIPAVICSVAAQQKYWAATVVGLDYVTVPQGHLGLQVRQS